MAKQARKRGPKKGAERDSPQYVHSPLVEVVFEIQFAGDPAVECRRDEFYAMICREFPIVGVPSAEPGKPPAMQPYHFKSEDGGQTVMIAINRFAYSTRQYQGFRAFRPRAVALAERFCKHFRIGRLNRTGLRYVNVIPFLREGPVIPWKRYFTVDFALPAASTNDFINLSLAVESRCEKGTITTRILCGKADDGSREVFLLDFDFANTQSLTSRKLETYIVESHAHTKKVFESILSENYKAVMRGEAVE